MSTEVESSSYNQAIKHDCLKQATQAELQALAANQTWVLIALPEGKVPIGSK